MQIVDSQIHLFPPNSEDYARKIGQTVMEPDAVISAMDKAGVARAYLVPAGGSAGNQTCIEAAAKWPDRFRVMGRIGLEKPEGRVLMADWKAKSSYVGLRLTFPPFQKASWLQDGTSDWFWPEAERLGVPLMVWAPEQASDLSAVAEKHPGLKIIIDHLNLYVTDTGNKVEKAVSAILPLSKLPNVAVKASALMAHSTEPYPFKDLHRSVQRVVDTFGPSRVMWGTDLSRYPDRYSEAISMFTDEMKFLSDVDLRKIMSETAPTWLGW